MTCSANPGYEKVIYESGPGYILGKRKATLHNQIMVCSGRDGGGYQKESERNDTSHMEKDQRRIPF